MINNEITLLSKRVICERGELDDQTINPFGDTKFQFGVNNTKSIQNI